MSSQDPQTITLYDLPTKNPAHGCWSPNVWKTRLTLNYKNLPYTTTWLPHPKITPTLSALDISPNPSGSAYTLPTITLPDNKHIMDSAAIALELERLYPEPSLRLEEGTHDRVMPLMAGIMPLLPVLYEGIRQEVILEETVEGWVRGKEEQRGVRWEEWMREEGGEKAWSAAAPGLVAMSKFLKESKRDEGPFILGSEVSYGDFVLASLMESCKRIREDIFERICDSCEGVRALHGACVRAGWFEKDR